MSALTLATGLVLAAIAASSFAYVSRAYASREVPAEHRRAHLMFVAFWALMAVATLADGALTFYGLVDWFPLAAIHAAMQVRIFATVAALGALMHYLLYIYSGRDRMGAVLAGYVGLLALLEYTAYRLDLAGLDVQPWRGWYEFHEPTGTLYQVAIAFLWLPVVVMGVVYAMVARQVEEPSGRYRGLMLSTGVTLLFLAWYLGMVDFQAPWWGLLQHGVSVLVAILAVMAVRPPGWAQRRFGARPLGASSGGAAGPPGAA